MPRKPVKNQPDARSMDFNALVEAIQQAHEHSAAIANRVVNTSLTLRNWVIGAYIAEYEMNGSDRAEYGSTLLPKLAERLKSKGLKRMDDRELRRYRLFYRTYPTLRESLTPEFTTLLQAGNIQQLIPEPIRESPTPESSGVTKNLFASLSFTHFAELIAIDDPLKRAFYEVECIRGNWSVRALKRQIASLYFERSGLSLDKEKLSAMANELADTAEPRLSIRDPYIFEFLGLKPQEAVAESDLEQALLENLQDFLLELGNGFCLEARQKSILIGDTRGFVDLVFYHRILRCHVLVELKVDEFRHEHIGQLNTYVAWYERNMMQEGDNPPVGLLLCTGKDHALVEYALSAMNQRLFVSKYQLELPSKEALQEFLDHKRKEVSGEV